MVVIACLIGVPVMFVVGVAWLVAKLIKKSSPPPMPEVKEPHD